MSKINLADAFAAIHEYWSPRLAAELNGQHVRLAKLKGAFVWHHHPEEDELFFVQRGTLVIELRTGQVTLNAGELFVVPRGVEHRPVAAEEVEVLLFEPATTRNTGNVENERTVTDIPRV